MPKIINQKSYHQSYLMFCMDCLIGLCERPNAGLGGAGEAGVSRGHYAAYVSRNILLVTYHHLEIISDLVFIAIHHFKFHQASKHASNSHNYNTANTGCLQLSR